MTAYGHGPNPRDALRRLAPGRCSARLSSFGSGWQHRVWEVDDDLVLRLNPDPDEAARALAVERDVRLLELIGPAVSVRVGAVVAADAGLGAMLLRRVPGRAVADGARTTPALADDLARLLTELWAVPSESAAQVAGTPKASPQEWLTQLRADFDRVADELDPADRRAVESWLEHPAPGVSTSPVLCHNDLGDEHLFLDADGRLCGVIDWTDAVVGDRARDLALIQFDLGLDLARAVMRAAGCAADAELWERARWFAIRAGVWGIGRRLAGDGAGVDAQLPRLRALLSGDSG